MATGAKVSFNHYQSGKFGTMPQQIKEMEISQDMHLKMSKKIAQLTKVIYALNTKNDENESIIASTREHHEEQVNQVFQEIKAKIENIQRQVTVDKDQNAQLIQLKSRLDEYGLHKGNAVAEFEQYKHIKDTQAMEMEAQHSRKVIEMSHDVLIIKREFQKRMALLEEMQMKMNQDKESYIQEERERHQREMEELTLRLQNTDELTAEQQRIQEEHRAQMEKLSASCEKLTTEKEKLVEEYEQKINKLHAFHENEMQVLRNMQSADADSEVQHLREELQKLMKDFSCERSEMTIRIEGLLGEMSLKEEEAEEMKSKIQTLKGEISNKNETIAALENQIMQVKAESARRQKELEELKLKYSQLKESDDSKSRELEKITVQIGKLNETKAQNEQHISDLQGKLKTAQERIKLLESSKRALEGQSSEQSKQLLAEIDSMSKQLSDMSEQMNSTESEHKKMINNLQETFAKKEDQFRKESKDLLEQRSQEYERDKEQLQKDHDFKLTRIKEELSAQLDSEISRLQLEKKQAEESSAESKSSLINRLSKAEKEVKSLTTQLAEEREACNAAKSKLKAATSQAEKYQKQFEANKSDLEQTQKDCKNLQSKIAALEKEQQSRISAKDAEAKQKQDELVQELNNKWMDKIQKECLKITDQITMQKNEEHEAILIKLTRDKDSEIKYLREANKEELQKLKKQLATLQSYADNLDAQHAKEREAEKAEAEAQMKTLREEMLEAANDYAKKIESMQSLYMKQLIDLTNQKDREKLALEEELALQHHGEITRLTTDHEEKLDTTQKEAVETLQRTVEKEKQQHEEGLARMRTELIQKHALETEQNVRAHQQQIAAARMELERAIDIGRQKDVEHQMQVSEMEETIRYRMLTIRSLEEDSKKMQRSISEMSNQLDAKCKEILTIRSEANKAAKLAEERLNTIHRNEIIQLTDEYMSEKQKMLSEFMEAQELLKDKISALNIMLEEAEDRYKNRESRDEDLERIRELQLAVQEREHLLRKLQDEKRKFQMELVNRETNFNKVFNANPQVGILNPLAPTKPRTKKGEKTLSKYAGSNSSLNSMGSGSGRLQPLPNSPLHDEQLNHTRPLPPTTKKFVK